VVKNDAWRMRRECITNLARARNPADFSLLTSPTVDPTNFCSVMLVRPTLFDMHFSAHILPGLINDLRRPRL
jgi:hypothetical protein